ncbi:MAG: FAD:protein FMN transferase [Halanaerobium sp.]|nr:FAD:protein FMN transferase [Halanaerobium sp.]
MGDNKQKRRNRIIGIISLLILLIILTGCGKGQTSGDSGYSLADVTQTSYLMGTLVQAKVYAPTKEKGEEVLDTAFQQMDALEKKMSLNIPASEIIRVNEAAGSKPVQVSEDTFLVLQKGLEYSKLTEGSFDISIGPLVKLWGIGTDQARVPSADEIKQKLKLVDYQSVLLQPEGQQVYLEEEGMVLDVGGIAKGYAADVTKEIFQEAGIKHAYISIGGNVLVVGNKPDGSPWKIGIQNPYRPRGAYLAIVEVTDSTVVTSGDYERYFEENGVRYHHIIDPATGYPTRNGLKSVSIITHKSLNADALSTGVFVLGIERGLQLLERTPDVEGILITEDKEVYLTSGLQGKVRITDKEFSLAD